MQNLKLTYAKCFLGTGRDTLIQTLNEMVERNLSCAVVVEHLIVNDFEKVSDVPLQNHCWDYLFDNKSQDILTKCLNNNVVLLCNYGNATPKLFVREIIKLAILLGLPQPKVVMDDQELLYEQATDSESFDELNKVLNQGNLVFNSQLQSGFDISACLLSGTQIILTKNISYSSLIIGAAMAHFDWNEMNQNQIASTSIIAYLLNCELQANHLLDDSEYASSQSFRLSTAEIFDDGSCMISKPESEKVGFNAFIVKKLYEIEDPSNFISPDIVANLGKLVVEDLGKNQVMLRGVTASQLSSSSESDV